VRKQGLRACSGILLAIFRHASLLSSVRLPGIAFNKHIFYKKKCCENPEAKLLTRLSGLIYFRRMKWLLLPFNLLQAIIVLFWTALSGILALLLRVILPPKPVVMFISRWFWSPLMLVLTGMHLRVFGRNRIIKHQPAIYISNHESQLDILVVVRAVTVPLFFVAKSELKKVPIVSHYLRAMGMILVDRGNREKARESMRVAAQRIHEGLNVITFPEGTRTKTGELLPFKKGTFIIAKDGRIPIVPVAIRGTRNMLPSGSFILKPGKVDVMIGDPVMPDQFAHLSPEEIAVFFRNKIGDMLSGQE